jgi:hypothetical protein
MVLYILIFKFLREEGKTRDFELNFIVS